VQQKDLEEQGSKHRNSCRALSGSDPSPYLSGNQGANYRRGENPDEEAYTFSSSWYAADCGAYADFNLQPGVHAEAERVDAAKLRKAAYVTDEIFGNNLKSWKSLDMVCQNTHVLHLLDLCGISYALIRAWIGV
jgi:hypothetical protein